MSEEAQPYRFEPMNTRLQCISAVPLIRVGIKMQSYTVEAFSPKWITRQFTVSSPICMCARCMSKESGAAIQSHFSIVLLPSNSFLLADQRCTYCNQDWNHRFIVEASVLFENLKMWPDRRFWTKEMLQSAQVQVMQLLRSDRTPADWAGAAERILDKLFPIDKLSTPWIWDRSFQEIQALLAQAWPFVLAETRDQYGIHYRAKILNDNPLARYANSESLEYEGEEEL